jgi:hypothetical protein
MGSGYSGGRGGEVTIRLKPSDNESHNCKVGAGTARQQRICQHKGGEGLGSMARSEYTNARKRREDRGA